MKWIGKIEEYVSGLFFVSGSLVSVYAVIMRYVFNKAPTWSLEVFEYLMVWAIFLGFGMALRENHHIVVDLLYDRLSFPVKRVLSVIANLIGAGFGVFMTVTGVEMIALAYRQHIVTIDAAIPIWVTYIVMPIGMGLLAFYFLVKCWRATKGDKKEILGHISHEKAADETTANQGGLNLS
jgi:C4-dicarboxylate transporter DctQ subunit